MSDLVSGVAMSRVLAFICVLSMPGFATAASTQQGIQMMRNFHTSDKCVAAAQKAFPDYTADSLRKRDAALQNCLAANNLPPRSPQAPPQQ